MKPITILMFYVKCLYLSRNTFMKLQEHLIQTVSRFRSVIFTEKRDNIERKQYS